MSKGFAMAVPSTFSPAVGICTVGSYRNITIPITFAGTGLNPNVTTAPNGVVVAVERPDSSKAECKLSGSTTKTTATYLCNFVGNGNTTVTLSARDSDDSE
jgi:hypothetical protein